MKMGLSVKEGAVLHDLLEHETGDIVVRLNAGGFIEHGTENLAEIGVDLSFSLFAPHIADLADAAYAERLRRHVDKALQCSEPTKWVEFPLHDFEQNQANGPPSERRWFALGMRSLGGEDGETCGALGLLRSVDRVRRLEDELFANALTDPLTGLMKRRVLLARLNAALIEETGGALVLLAIDGMRALKLQYGQRTIDEISWGFAKFLQSMTPAGAEVGQIDEERFAILCPQAKFATVRAWAEDLLATFSALALTTSGKSPKLTASAGLTRIENSVDWVLRQGELALIMARAGGGNRMALSDGIAVGRAHPAGVARECFEENLGVGTQRR